MYLHNLLLLDRFRFYQLITWYNKFIQQQGFVCALKDRHAVFTTQSYTSMHRYRLHSKTNKRPAISEGPRLAAISSAETKKLYYA